MLRRIFTGWLWLSSLTTYGQWTDRFTDGDVTQTPEWTGETEKFDIIDEVLHLSDAAATGSAYLSTPSEAVADATWEFYVEISENPSSSNFTRLYLMADQVNVSGELNGYFVMVGGSEDEVSLYRQDGNNSTKIIDGADQRVDTKPVRISIRVTRDTQGNWELFSQPADEPDFISEGTVRDEMHTVSRYFGVYCQYTATRKDAFAFDDFVVTGVPQPDTAPPTIIGSSLLSATQLELTFSEALDIASSQTLSHYELNSRSITSVRTPDALTVILAWDKPLTNGEVYSLRVTDVRDEAGNALADTTLRLRYFMPVDAQWQDVVINEWMADPNPVVTNLPEAEFIELYNPSAHPFQLQGWTLNNKPLPDYLLLPDQYVILSPASQAAHFAQYGAVVSPTRWPTLPNGGDNLVLKDAEGKAIDSLSYAEDWVDGGVSTERIRSDRPCDQRSNYGISRAADGATPGAQNSLFTNLPDTQAPELQRAMASGSRTVRLHFTEAVATERVQMTVSPTVGIAQVQRDPADETTLMVSLTEDLSDVSYAIAVQRARDCYGNEAASLTTRFYYDSQPPLIERVTLRDTATLQVVFNEPLVSAGEPGAYFIDNGIGAARSAEWLSDSISVLLDFSASLDNGLTNRLRINNVTDRYGNTADSLLHSLAFRTDIDTVRVVSAYQVNVTFAAAPLPTAAQLVENYRIDRGLEHPNVAVILSPTEVQLIYDRPLSANKEHELQIENLVDIEEIYLSTPVYRFAHDQRAPLLDSVSVVDERTLVAHFSEEMARNTEPSATAFTINPTIGSPERVERRPGGQSFTLHLSRPLAQETTYKLSVVGLADRSGNVITSAKENAFYYDQRPPSLHRGQLIAPNQIQLEFHEPLTAASASHPQHYTLWPGTHPDSVVTSTIHPERVTLFFAHPLSAATLSLRVTQVADQYGNMLNTPVSVEIDNRRPALGNVVPLSATELRLDFTKSLDVAVMEQVSNYQLDSMTQPVRVVVGGPYDASVTLRWSAPLTADSEHTITIHRLTDQGGATSEAVTASFTYDTKVASVTTDRSGLTVEFTVPVDGTTTTDVSHYEVTDMGTPVAAILIDLHTVRLVFAPPFAESSIHTLTLNGLLDQDKRIIPASQHTVGLGQPPGYHQLLITEVMADPSPTVGLPDAEYVELFNASDRWLSTQGVRFSDANTTIVLPTVLLAPHEYVILSSASDQTALSRYGRTISGGNLPTLNTTGDSLRLTDANGQNIFSIAYSDDWYNDVEKRNGGWSLEMVDTQRPCGEQDNWTVSVDPAGGTPGQENSVQQANPDRFGPKVRRAWAVSDTVVEVAFSEKLDATSVRSAQLTLSEGLAVRSVRWLPSRKLAIVTLQPALRPGRRYSVRVGGVTDCSGNLISDHGNTATLVLPEAAEEGDVLLSELLFRPRSGGEKFVELYNHSDKHIDLHDWFLANVAEDSLINSESITGDHYLLAPGEYVALTEDPTTLKADYPASPEPQLLKVDKLPSLPAEEGTIVLLNPAQETMQRFSYSNRYHHPVLDNTQGVALERIAWDSPVGDPATWQSAAKTVGYATPGYRNSQRAGGSTSTATLSVDPPVFAPGYPGRADYTRIRYRFEQPGAVANVIVYDAQGGKVRDLAQNTTLAEAGFLVWDGTDDHHQRVSLGYYLIFFEVFDTQGKVNVFKEKVVVGGF